MKKLILVIVLFLCGYVGYNQYLPSSSSIFSDSETSLRAKSNNDEAFDSAFKNHASNLQLEGSGRVIKVLPDDTKGSLHQKFLVKLNSGQKLLIAHNIDLAPRVNSLSQGDQINFYGEYEWNAKGGVVHWTHRDPSGSHIAGWLEHNGKKYQ